MKLYKTLLFIFSVIFLLALLSVVFPQPSVEVGGLTLRFPTMDRVLKHNHDSLRRVEDILLEAERTFEVVEVDSAGKAESDSLAFYARFFSSSSTRIYCPNNDSTYLFGFFESLDAASRNPVHIMHYGDSQIEGDRISSYLRKMLQSQFGGYGPGLLPLQQPVASMSVEQSLSDSVRMYYAGGMLGGRNDSKRYGSMAQMACVDMSDTLHFRLRSCRGSDVRFVTVYAGHVDSLMVFNVGGERRVVSNYNGIQALRFDLGSQRKSLSIDIHGQGEIYGIDISSNTGVSLTNIPLRGSDGTFFKGMDVETARYMHDKMNTRLVIMEFGGNAMPAIDDSTKVDRWCRNFSSQIKAVRNMAPNAKILVVGPADMSTKINGELQTYPLLPYLVEQMRSSVINSGAAFWNMYDVMGGKESMISWVSHNPKWAAPDYVHFTKKGSERISQVLCESLMIYYNYMKYIRCKKCEQ